MSREKYFVTATKIIHIWLKNICRVVIVYLAGVVFGGVGGSLPSPTSYLAGASAGVYALIAAHVSTLVMNWKVKIIFYEKYFRNVISSRKTEPYMTGGTRTRRRCPGRWIL